MSDGPSPEKGPDTPPEAEPAEPMTNAPIPTPEDSADVGLSRPNEDPDAAGRDL